MGKCLVTKLSSIVDDSELIGLNEIVFEGMSNCVFRITPKSGSTINYESRKGDIYLDSEKTEKLTTISSSQGMNLWGNEGCELGVDSKYKLLEIYNDNTKFQLEQLQYIDTSVRRIDIYKDQDINDIVFANFLSLNSVLSIHEGVVVSNINQQAINKILSFTAVYDFAQVPAINFVGTNSILDLRLYYRSGDDLNKVLGNNINLRSLQFNGVFNTWPSTDIRDHSYTPIGGIHRFKTPSDADNYLINMSLCVGTDYQGYKNITIQTGATSASDSAVASLRARGYTVTV